jgi:hypothetical protein
MILHHAAPLSDVWTPQTERVRVRARDALLTTFLTTIAPDSRRFTTVRRRPVCRLTCRDLLRRTPSNTRPTPGGQGGHGEKSSPARTSRPIHWPERTGQVAIQVTPWWPTLDVQGCSGGFADEQTSLTCNDALWRTPSDPSKPAWQRGGDGARSAALHPPCMVYSLHGGRRRPHGPAAGDRPRRARGRRGAGACGGRMSPHMPRADGGELAAAVHRDAVPIACLPPWDERVGRLSRQPGSCVNHDRYGKEDSRHPGR